MDFLSYEPLFPNFSPALAEALVQILQTADSCSKSESHLIVLLAILFLISLHSLYSDCALRNKLHIGAFLVADILYVPVSWVSAL